MATIKAFSAVAATIALLAAAPAFALSVSTGITGNANVNAGTGVNVSVGAQTNASGSATDTSSANTDTSSNASVSSNADLSIPLVITQADVSTGNAQPTQVSADAVQTQSDLSGFVAAKLQGDANLSAVNTASDHVAVIYKEPAKFLGVFPISVDTTATTDASGNVSISQPWWAFFAPGESASLQINVQSNVNAVLGANASTNTSLSASQQAQLVAAMQSAMAASANFDASGSASPASGGVNVQ